MSAPRPPGGKTSRCCGPARVALVCWPTPRPASRVALPATERRPLSGMELDPLAVRICHIARLNRHQWPQPRIRLMEEAGVFLPENKLDYAKIRAVIEQ